jgi:hypothetical protein
LIIGFATGTPPIGAWLELNNIGFFLWAFGCAHGDLFNVSVVSAEYSIQVNAKRLVELVC